MKKNVDRFISAIYCDDIRHEMGNKLSLMGCYQSELIVASAPVALTKLCVYATATTSIERPFKSLKFRILQDDKVEMARLEVPIDGLEMAAQFEDSTATRKTVGTALIFAPLVIERPMSIRVYADTEEGEIVGPRLLVKIADSEVPAVPVAQKSSRLVTKRKPTKKQQG